MISQWHKFHVSIIFDSRVIAGAVYKRPEQKYGNFAGHLLTRPNPKFVRVRRNECFLKVANYLRANYYGSKSIKKNLQGNQRRVKSHK